MKVYIKFEGTMILRCDENADVEELVSGIEMLSDQDNVIVEDAVIDKYTVTDAK